MNQFDEDYKKLLKKIIETGVEKSDRTGTGTLSVFGNYFEYDMKNGFPLTTLRKMLFNNNITELLWFLKGRTDLRYLLENRNKIWAGDCFKRFQKINLDSKLTREEFIDEILNDNDFSKQYGDCGPIYGKQWRAWQNWIDIPETHKLAKCSIWIDQIANLIQDLKSNPDSRRLMVSAWNPSDLQKSILPACHYGFQCYTTKLTAKERFNYYQSGIHNQDILEIYFLINEKESDNENVHNWLNKFAPFVPTRKLDLCFNMRSVDMGLGFPSDIAVYALLLELLCLEVNMIPNKLSCFLGDTHIYLNQVEQMKELIDRESYELPKLNINKKQNSDFLKNYEKTDFQLENYKHGQFIKIPLSN